MVSDESHPAPTTMKEKRILIFHFNQADREDFPIPLPNPLSSLSLSLHHQYARNNDHNNSCNDAIVSGLINSGFCCSYDCCCFHRDYSMWIWKEKRQEMKAKKMKKAPKKNAPKREKKEGVIVPQTAQALPKKKGKGKGSSKSLGKAKQQQQIKPPERGIIVPMTIQTINIDGNAPESDEEEQKYPQQQDAQAEINEEHVEEQTFAPPAAPAMPASGPEETPEEITRQGMAKQGDVQYNTLADLDVAIFEEGGQPQPNPNDGDYE